MILAIEMPKKIKYCLYLLAWSFSLCRAQNLTFDHLNVEHGLSHNSAMCITQDDRGFIWAGTRNGLNRYDGTHFRVYRGNPRSSSALTSNYINALLFDSRKTLWVGTSYGLNQYVDSTDNFERMYADPKVPGTLSSNLIKCIYEDRNGQIWVGTVDGLNLLTDRKKKTFKRITLAEKSGKKIRREEIQAIWGDHAGVIWVGTSTGLVSMSSSLKDIRIYNHDKNIAGSLNDDYVTALYEDPAHRLWIGTLRGGLNLYDRAKSSFSYFTRSIPSGIIHNNIREIVPDKNGKLWIGTLEGLSIFDPEKGTAVSYQHEDHKKKSLSQNSIYSIFQDSKGSFWIGTYYGGMNVSHPQSIPFTVYQNNSYYSSISDNVISSFQEDDQHNLWIGTEGGGLNYFKRNPANPSTGQFTAFKNKQGNPNTLGSNLIKTLFKDRDGNIWAGTHAGGLNLYDPKKQKFTRFIYQEEDSETFRSEISNVLEDSQGRFWVCTQRGLKLFRRNGTSLDSIPNTYFGDKSINPRVLFESSDQKLWMGGGGGLFYLEKGAKTIKEADLSHLKSRNVFCILEDHHRQIWVGTDFGFGRLNSKTGEVFTEKEGLVHNNVIGMLEDRNGFFWMSTGNGLSKFDPVKRTFRNYNTSDGLSGNEFNNNAYFKSSSGEFFFGSINGFVSFRPDRVETNEAASPVLFTGLKLFNNLVEINGKDGVLEKDMSMTREITLRHNQDVITIEFALLNYIKSNKNKYAYFLEGFDKDWNYVNTPDATYTNLPAGTYTFLVKGANNDGIWSEPAQMKITVLPPFWRTWWAYCLYFILAAALIFFVSRFFFLRELFKKENELHMFKLNFFTNISHEIRTHLSLIIGPLDKLILSSGEDNKSLKIIKKNSDNLLELVNELMDFRKAETGHLVLHVNKNNLVGFVEEIFVSFKNIAEAKNISIELVTPEAGIDLYFDREQLKKVFYNLLSNACKFTPEGGRIVVEILENEQKAEVKVTDNGKGISPENISKLFVNYFQEEDHGTQNTGYGIGLALSKSIVELHSGQLNVVSEVPKNAEERQTTFTVTLPKGKGHFKPEQLTSQAEHSAGPVKEMMNKSDIAELKVERELIPVSENSPVVLLVEDNAEVRAFLSESLNQQYKIIESDNGISGWETAVEQIPDLIISDVMMPGMNGFALCEKLKSDPRTSHIPVILLTAQTSHENQVSGLELGADLYLTKPFSIRILELHIRNLLESREKLRRMFSQEVAAGNAVLSTTGKIDDIFLTGLIKIIEDNLENPDFNVANLSREVGMSQPILYKKIKAVTNMTVNDFVKSIRLKNAVRLLQQKDMTVYEVANAVGFDDWKYFSREFKKQYGTSPGKF